MRDTDNMEKIEAIYTLAKTDPFHEEGEVLGSMTTTPPPEALRITLHYLSKNYGDPSLFKSLKKLSDMLAEETKRFLRLPDYPVLVTSGGTESNILALYSLGRHTGRKVVVAPESVHHSVAKACQLLGFKLKRIPTDEMGFYVFDKLEAVITREKSILVLTMGTTELGIVDDIGAVKDILADTGTPLHIDAAFGGFTFPFTHPGLYDSWMESLLSHEIFFTFSVDYHKFPGAPIPSGGLLFPPELESKLYFDAPYMPSGRQHGILGTRPGFSVASSLATLLYYGVEGLRRLAVEKLGDSQWLASRVRGVGGGLSAEPGMVPITCIRTADKQLEDRLMDSLWGRRLYVYRCGRYSGVRVVHMPHVDRNALVRLLDALENIVKG